jgi:hypothetical protein
MHVRLTRAWFAAAYADAFPKTLPGAAAIARTMVH